MRPTVLLNFDDHPGQSNQYQPRYHRRQESQESQESQERHALREHIPCFAVFSAWRNTRHGVLFGRQWAFPFVAAQETPRAHFVKYPYFAWAYL
jgi:hypothetical protein